MQIFADQCFVDFVNLEFIIADPTLSFDTKKYQELLSRAIDHFWETRSQQKSGSPRAERGNRGAVTGGKQLDGFLILLRQVAIDAGVSPELIFDRDSILPGYFRPTKSWDFLIKSRTGKLLLVVEMKSQVGSFGNNFNNRAEEALGSSEDFWTAFRENAFQNKEAPWLGYIMIAEKSEKSTKKVRLANPHFEPFPEFLETGYLDRYRILCEKLMLERKYNFASLLWTNESRDFGSASDNISIESFLRAFFGYLVGKSNEFEE